MEGQASTGMEEQLIAPCGMNCALCVNYQALVHQLKKKGFGRSYCPGCLPRGKHCAFMKQSCELLGNGLVRFCYECADFPCRRLKALDRRYRGKYHLSMIENLRFIQVRGLAAFLQAQEEQWRCPQCGGTVCCHNGLCLGCQLDTLRQNKQYRWGEQ